MVKISRAQHDKILQNFYAVSKGWYAIRPKTDIIVDKSEPEKICKYYLRRKQQW